MRQEGVRKEMIYTGNCLDILPTLDAESVQCCVTSDTGMVQFFAPQVKGIALGNVFIGERFVGNYERGNVKMIITGDCLEVMKSMEANTVQCCVTSPPYW